MLKEVPDTRQISGEPRRRRFRYGAACVAGLLLALIPFVLAVGALCDPTSSLHGMLGSALWTTAGPHLLLLSLLALGLAVYAFRRAPRYLAVPALMLATCASTGSAYITMGIVAATSAAGGSINPVSSLFLHSMVAGGPDETATFTVPGGRPLQAAVYRPPESEAAAPILLYIHGGGFMVGTVTETDADLRWFADRGWLVVSIEYRLFPEGAPTWDLAPVDFAYQYHVM